MLSSILKHGCSRSALPRKAWAEKDRTTTVPCPCSRFRQRRRLNKQVQGAASRSESPTVIREARQAAAAGSADPLYLNGATFLKTVGFKNQAEIARVLDIAMNPTSLFLTYHDYKRAVNASARPLDVERDMRPVVDFLSERVASSTVVMEIISKHPPVLSYSVEQRLKPFWDYLESIGVQNVGKAVAQRPTLLGLDVDTNLRKVVDYLQSTGTPPETIVKYMEESI